MNRQNERRETTPTKVNLIPEGYHTVIPVLTVQGAAKLIDFMKQAFDAKELYRLDRRAAELSRKSADGGHGGKMLPRAIVHRYVGLWIITALLLAGLLAFAEYRRNPLNDPDQAQQRTGVLLPTGREPAPKVPALDFTGRPAVILFARTLTGRHLFHDLADQADLTRDTEFIVVTPDGSRPIVEAGIDGFLVDQNETIARAFDLRKSIDGGYPIGYVLVDSSGFVRFRTLDPGYGRRAWEIRLLLSEMQP